MDEARYNLIFYTEHTWGFCSSVSQPWDPQVNGLDKRKALFACRANELASRALNNYTFARGETAPSLLSDFYLTVFHLMKDANRVGLILEGRVQAQKPFPNGSQINVSVRNPGSMIGPAAVFSRNHKYPCDVVTLEPSVIMMFRREDILLLLQKDLRIMRNFMAELATAAAMLQERLELLSYSGIAQKAAFYLLIHAQRSGKSSIRIPESVSNWAMIMNVSRSSLHRELKKLEDDGIIAYTPPMVEIRDEAALQDVLGK